MTAVPSTTPPSSTSTSTTVPLIGLLRALHEAGRRVPEDVSVVGFDDLPETGYLIPPLTTVRQDFPALGRLAIEMLLIALGGATAPAPDLIPPELIIRASTGLPPRAPGRSGAARTPRRP